MTEFFLSLGSNIEPGKNVPACLQRLKEEFHVTRISSVYETVPIGPAGKQNFWNLTVSIESTFTFRELQSALNRIEQSLGRERDPADKFAPRTIDIDILPQKDYQKHGFIIIPLAEMAPKSKDPETGKSFEELAGEIQAKDQGIKKVRLADKLR